MFEYTLPSKHEDAVLSAIIEDYRSGLWSVPESLSECEWAKRKNNVAMFIASLYIGAPPPRIMVLESPEMRSSDEYESRNHVWMLEGHQGILALIKAMDKNSDLRIVFNPRVTGGAKGAEGQFRVASAMTKKTPEWIDVSRVLGSKEDFCSILDEEKDKVCRLRFIQLREILNRRILIRKVIDSNYGMIVQAVEVGRMMRKDLRKRKATCESANLDTAISTPVCH